MSEREDLLRPPPQMYTQAGDAAIRALCKRVERRQFEDGLDYLSTMDLLRQEMEKLAQVHGEVYDTEPRWFISYVLTKRLSRPNDWPSIDL